MLYLIGIALLATVDASSTVKVPKQLPIVSLDAVRSERFPSREERVKIYMSNWYVPPCGEYKDGLTGYHSSTTTAESEWLSHTLREPVDMVNSSVFELDSAIEPDKVFVLDRDTILDCSIPGQGDAKYSERIKFRTNMFMYCSDVATSLLFAIDHVTWEQPEAVMPPILLQFGDLKHSHVYRYISLPHIKKFRFAASNDELRKVTDRQCYDSPRARLKEDAVLQPIVWKLATLRHYQMLNDIAVQDTPWVEKKNMAVFRGQLTGSLGGYNKSATADENCFNICRCRLVYDHYNSTLLNARLTSTRRRIPELLNGVELTSPTVSVRYLLQYKGIVMLEGNDVASGLKWALLSNSVVLMPRPKHTSWAMEELLQPWVHYVPLNDKVTDVEEKMQWILEHDKEAQRISYAATLWMQDLVFHPDAAEDDRWIEEEILRRYLRHFVPLSSSSLSSDALLTAKLA